MDLIESEFLEKATIQGGTYLFNPKDAIALVGRCCQLKIRILGIAAFLFTEKSTQLSLEYSVDFSANKNINGNWSEAEHFIKDKAKLGLLFDIFYEEIA